MADREEKEMTPQEIVRKEIFDKKVEELTAEGWEQKRVTVSIVKANVIACLIMLPFVIILAVVFYLVNKDFEFNYSFLTAAICLVIMFVETVVHELIHGATWFITAKCHKSDIEFGVIWKMLTPYCYCRKPMTKMSYIVGSVMPTVFLGFIQGIIGIVTGNLWIILLAAVLFVGGGGDFMITGMLLKYKQTRKNMICMDHPTELGLVVFEKD